MLTIKRLSIADAHLLIEGARNKANEFGIPMCIAITDESGNLMAFERMDGSKVTAAHIAIDKSFTASAGKKGTDAYGPVVQPGAPAFGINTAIGGRLIVVGGGVPVEFEGEVIGAIGVSAGSPTQDQEAAQAGIDHMMAQYA